MSAQRRPDKQFSTTRLRPGYDEEEVDAVLDEAELRLAASQGDSIPATSRPGGAMRCRLTLTGAAAIVMVAAACSGTPTSTQASRPHRAAASRPAASPAIAVVATSAWWKPDAAPNCGSPALVRVSGRVGRVGDCAGLLIIPAVAMSLRAGQRIDVHVLDVSLPRSSDRAVLAQITISPNGATGTYQARRPGHATLISAAGWCVGLKVKGETKGSCPFLDVTVLPADRNSSLRDS